VVRRGCANGLIDSIIPANSLETTASRPPLVHGRLSGHRRQACTRKRSGATVRRLADGWGAASWGTSLHRERGESGGRAGRHPGLWGAAGYKRFHGRPRATRSWSLKTGPGHSASWPLSLLGSAATKLEPRAAAARAFTLARRGWRTLSGGAIAALAHDVDRSYARFLSRNPDRSSRCRTSMRVDWPSSWRPPYSGGSTESESQEE
jgi:hypothetical protein